jgi:hypothetical protein
MVTVSVPSEISGVPAAYCGAGVDADGAEDGLAAPATGVVLTIVGEVAAGAGDDWGEDFPHAEASSATEAAAAAVTMTRREAVWLICGPFRIGVIRKT